MKTYYSIILVLVMTLSFTSCKKESQTQTIDQESDSFPNKNLDPLERFGELLVAVQTNRVFPDGKTFRL